MIDMVVGTLRTEWRMKDSPLRRRLTDEEGWGGYQELTIKGLSRALNVSWGDAAEIVRRYGKKDKGRFVIRREELMEMLNEL